MPRPNRGDSQGVFNVAPPGTTLAAWNRAWDRASARNAAADARNTGPSKPTPTQTSAAPASSPTTSAAPSSNLTVSQQNAVKSANGYLQTSGFSRQGLIDQLSSSAGEGYSVHDATVAVDSLNVDWNAQAVRSAKDYLHTSSFSCQGLVEQLSSSAGAQFTVAQAQYAAHQVGLC